MGRERRKWRHWRGSAVLLNFLQVYNDYLVDLTHPSALKRKKALTEACFAGQTVQCSSNCEKREEFVNHFSISDFISLKAQLGIMCLSKWLFGADDNLITVVFRLIDQGE